MIEKFEQLQSSIVSVVEVDPQDTRKYGVLDADPLAERVTKIRGLVEKPAPEKAPSNLAITGRYILTSCRPG
jgi:UTP--glucose-1-phosphate uridylyltransferase